MINAALPKRREVTEKLRQVCMTALGTGINGALHSSYAIPKDANSMGDLIGKLKRIP